MRISFSSLYWLIIIMFFCAALYFTVKVEMFKRSLNISANEHIISSGQRAKVVKVIDGDEISVVFDNKQFIIRILGIYSYDPSINDRQVQNIAALAFDFLKDLLVSKDVEIVFDEYKNDDKKRLLAYIEINGRDIGRAMVENGFSIVYTKYPFSRMDKYIVSERMARNKRRGMWGIRSVIQRSEQLKQVWNKDREN